jgi:hypothetical protein
VQKDALLLIKYSIFHRQLKDAMSKVPYTYHKLMENLKEVVHCWKIESNDIDEDDLGGIQIKEIEGECEFEGNPSDSTMLYYVHSIKTKKHNIGTKEAPNMVIIKDYWDKETITHVVDFLKNKDMFLTELLGNEWNHRYPLGT